MPNVIILALCTNLKKYIKIYNILYIDGILLNIINTHCYLNQTKLKLQLVGPVTKKNKLMSTKGNNIERLFWRYVFLALVMIVLKKSCVLL